MERAVRALFCGSIALVRRRAGLARRVAMSLIPYVLGRLSSAPQPVSAGPARYDPGAGHRPVAALVAVGLPAALLVAVALSPFEMPQKKKLPQTTFLNLPAPVPPPPDPEPKPRTAPEESVITAPISPIPPVTQNPVEPTPITDPLPRTPDPVIGTAPPTIIESVPAVPPLIEARLDPRFAGSFQPDYPPFEQRNEIEGISRVRVLVGTDGRIKAVEDAGTTSPGFFTETRRRALAKWRFKPATRGGTAEESWITMTVRFRLEK
jgi:periplasmic protein TonB